MNKKMLSVLVLLFTVSTMSMTYASGPGHDNGPENCPGAESKEGRDGPQRCPGTESGEPENDEEFRSDAGDGPQNDPGSRSGGPERCPGAESKNPRNCQG